MCSSFEVIVEKETLMLTFGKTGKSELILKSEISERKSRMRPTDLVKVICKKEDENHLREMKLGFRVKTGQMINFRIEEITSGKTDDYWQSLLRENSCLFVMSGYHKWKDIVIDIFTPKTGKPTKKKMKQTFRFTIKDQCTFFCRGYYRKEGNDFACTLITTKGNVITNLVHQKDRMPVILDLEVGIKFLEAELEEKIALCQSYPPDKMNYDKTTL